MNGQGGPGHHLHTEQALLVINQILVTARQLSRIEVDRLHYQSSQGGAVKKKPKLLDGWEEDKHGLVSSEKHTVTSPTEIRKKNSRLSTGGGTRLIQAGFDLSASDRSRYPNKLGV